MSTDSRRVPLAGAARRLSARGTVERLLRPADIRIDGDRPWDPQVRDRRVFRRVLAQGSLGLGEAFVDGWWDCAALDELVHRIWRAGLTGRVGSWRTALAAVRARLLNLQTPARARRVGLEHYDAGNDLFRCMLDRRMIYTCGYWQGAATLDEAQEAKLELVCRKLHLEPGMRVLDVGCGWGGAAKFAAERYGVEVVGVTISAEQAELARESCRGLPVEIRLADYRSVRDRFDRVYSLGMFEHVGYKNYRTFMEVVARCLPEDGLFLLHTIGGNTSVTTSDPWIARYIFPNSMLPSAGQISAAADGLFVPEDWHSFGPDYDRTLMAWSRNVDAHWEGLEHRYDERFHRMWQYYLKVSAGCFRAGENRLWQIVLAPVRRSAPYHRERHGARGGGTE